jgi:putative DNA primase/helicase
MNPEDFKDYTFDPSKEKFEDLDEEEQNWVDSKLPSDPTKQEVKSTKQDKRPLDQAVDFLTATFKFVTIAETGEILYYSNGVYEKGAEIIIKKYTQALLGTRTTLSLISEIIGNIQRSTFVKREDFDSDINIINLQNGLYDIERNELLPHTPDYLSLNQKPIFYDKNARPKLFGKFLRQVLNPEERKTALQAMSYTFHRDYELEYIFILFGLGANGKSVFTSIMTALHGRHNVSNVTIKQMIKNDFALSDLENKDVNIDSEAVGYISNTAVLKRLTGGSKQPIRVEPKFKQAYDTILYAKLFLNANKMPVIEDLTNADSRRFVILTFPNEFDSNKADPKLVSKLTTPQELSGVFNVLMIHLREVRRSEKIHLNEKTIEERRQKYERTANPVKEFLNENVYEAEDGYIRKPDLYNSFKDYCKEYKIPLISMDKLGKEVKKLHYPEDIELEIKSVSKKIDHETVRIWAGIRLIPKKLEEKPISPLLGDLR